MLKYCCDTENSEIQKGMDLRKGIDLSILEI